MLLSLYAQCGWGIIMYSGSECQVQRASLIHVTKDRAMPIIWKNFCELTYGLVSYHSCLLSEGGTYSTYSLYAEGAPSHV